MLNHWTGSAEIKKTQRRNCNILIEVLTSIAENERNTIRSRQAEGLAAMPVDENSGKKSARKPDDALADRQSKCQKILPNTTVNGEIRAVLALLDGSTVLCTTNKQELNLKNIPLKFPVPVDGNYKNLFAYLTGRGISAETIQMLIRQNVM